MKKAYFGYLSPVWAAGLLALAAGSARATAPIPPDPVDFGQVANGQSKTLSQGYICPSATSSCLEITGYAITGPNAADFVVVSQNCTGYMLGPLQTCSFNISFTPTVCGPESASLEVFIDGAPTQDNPLTGTGTAPPLQSLTLSPTSIIGGPAGPGGVMGTATLMGTAPTDGTEVDLQSTTLWPPSDLTAPDTASVDSPVTVPAGDPSVTFPVDTSEVLFPLVAEIKGVTSCSGGSKTAAMTADLTVLPPKIPPMGPQANARVSDILIFFFKGNGTTTSLAAYQTALTDLVGIRDFSQDPQAGQDIYLAAADHYLFAAITVGSLPQPVRTVVAGIVALIGVPGYDAWKGIAAGIKLIWSQLPAEIQADLLPFIPQSVINKLSLATTAQPPSAPTPLSVLWGETGVVAGLTLS
jgi:hypothetical protein